MSDTSQGPDWWQASDGKWYPPQSAVPPPPPPPASAAGAGGSAQWPAGTGAVPPPPAWTATPGLPPAGARRGTNGFAIAALVLGILWLCAVGSVLAIIFGFVALSQIKRSGQSGKGMAIAGIVLGVIGLLATAASVVALRAAADEIETNQPGERDDVRIVECGKDDEGRGVAKLEVTNDSSKESVYFITVEFRAAGSNDDLGSSIVSVRSVESGETVDAEAVSDERLDAERIDCRIDFVERLASG